MGNYSEDRWPKMMAPILADISSQLRAALSTLHLAAGQLIPADAREKDPELDAKAARLDQSYYQLLRLATNLSLLSHLRQREAPLQLVDLDIVEIVSEVCAQAESLAHLRGIELKFDSQFKELVCATDRFWLEQLLFQFLSNAFKVTPPGQAVTVQLYQSNDKDGVHPYLAVRDEGHCFPTECALSSFDMFSKQSPPLSAPGRGAGFGLTLANMIAGELGGYLLVEAQPDSYTRFIFSFPLRKAPKPPKGQKGTVSDVPLDYTGGFNRVLVALADALPAQAFLLRNEG